MYEKLTKCPNFACYMLENIYPIFLGGGGSYALHYAPPVSYTMLAIC